MNMQNYEVNRAHREQVYREADHQRLVQQAQQSHFQRNAALIALGRQMVRIGERLQNQ